MTEWDVFIASINLTELMRERPGSPSDREMRAKHIRRRERFYRDARRRVRVADDAAAVDRRKELADASREWNERSRRRSDLDKTIAAYAARKRAEARKGKVA